MEGFPGRSLLGQFGKGTRERITILATQGLTPLSFMTQCQPTVLKTWYALRETNVVSKDSNTASCSKDSSEERLWQVEESKLSSSERSTAEGNLFKIDLRIHGFSEDAVLEDQGRMTKIQEKVVKLRTEHRTESVIPDLSKTGEFNRFSEESKKTVEKSGKIDLFELTEVSKKIQCPSCAKNWQGRLLNCTCGICLVPSTEQRSKIKNQFEILPIPIYIVKKDYSRGAKHGRTQALYDHFKASEPTRHAKKKESLSIAERWHRDEFHRNSQIAIRWTTEYCQYVDSVKIHTCCRQ